MRIEDAKMWRKAYAAAHEYMRNFDIAEVDTADEVYSTIMCAYVEGVKDAQDDQKSPT